MFNVQCAGCTGEWMMKKEKLAIVGETSHRSLQMLVERNKFDSVFLSSMS